MIKLPKSRVGRSAAIGGAAVVLVAGFEGLRTAAYLDYGPQVPTICYGETRGVKLGDTATVEQCDAMLIATLSEFSRAIDKCLPPAIPDESYVAFLSAAYNIGPAAFCGSSMSRRALQGDMLGACNALPLWNKVTMGGVRVPLPGLTKRREAEREMCLEGLL